MSDTSEYTIVDDTSSSSPSSLSDLVQAPDPTSGSSPRRDSYKFMGHAVKEIAEVMQIIRNSIITIYEALLIHIKNDGWPDEEVKDLAAGVADEFVDMLQHLGETVALLPEEGHEEISEAMIEILLEVSSMLVIDGKRESQEELSAQTGALIFKCLAQLRLCASRLHYSAQSEVLRKPAVKDIILRILELHSFMYHENVHLMASVFKVLLPKYVHSLTAVYGSASGVSFCYVDYAKTVLLGLDRGKPDEAAEETESESTDTETRGLESTKNTKMTKKLEKPDGEKKTIWIRPWAVLQVYKWCSSFWL